MPEGLQGLDAVRAGLLHRQRVPLAVRRTASVGDLLQGLAADVLHDDVPVQRTRPLVEVLHEVVDPHDVGVLDLREEAPLGDRGGHRVLVAGVEQALEDHPAVRHRAVHRQVDPAETAVRQAAHDLVLAVDDVAALQLRDERVRVAALGAEALRAPGVLTPRTPHRRPAVGARAEPLALGHLRVLQHHRARVGPRHPGDLDQTGAESAAGGRTGGRAGAAHRHRTARGAARHGARQPARHRAPGLRRLRGRTGTAAAADARAGAARTPGAPRRRRHRRTAIRPGRSPTRPARDRRCRSTVRRRPCPRTPRRSRAADRSAVHRS